ncbi:MAG: hypothetical protein J7623_06385 [Chitinophaga sp.]|uniref:hypothetical protein n=1 Tax=Chitinophaga sp. TaxID=1869181 RepID=UPI001B1283D7|nr:hypothetical protein [Chitinophaga sp.]MBO9728250.1 hypothetical protein [Chitinophaga sp.]
MNTETACPWCGSTEIIRTIPEKDPFNVMLVCQKCHRVISEPDDSHTRKTRTVKHNIEENTMQLCLSKGKIHGVMYYFTEMNKQPGVKISMHQAKDTVDSLLATRGLTNAVKKPNKNGCVIVLIVLVLIVASVIYFYTHRG